MERKTYPAPIDGKNVTHDWIEDIFDNQSCLYGKNSMLGYINDEVVLARWEENRLMWEFIKKSYLNSILLSTLIKRLAEHYDLMGDLVEKFDLQENTLVQSFYWKEEC